MRVFVIVRLFCLLLNFTLAFPSWACTSFCLDTPAGPVFGANLDLFIPGDGLVFVNQRGITKEGCQQSTTGKTARWTSKYGSVTFSLAGREFAWSGMNEAGLVVNSLELKAGEYPEPDERPPVLDGRWVQYVLDNCGSVREVLQVNSLVRVQDENSSSHYLVADADGSCAAIEYLDGRFVSHTGEDLPVKAMSNMRYAHALAALKRGGPRWWWSNPGQSAERFAAAHTRSENYDASRDTSAVSYAFETLTNVVVAPHTKWNIVYDIAKREIWFRSVASPTVKHLSLAAFDFSCGIPLQMLDMNAAIEGDAVKFFTSYDRDVNLHVFRMFCARYGVEISAEEATDLIQLWENFGCAP